MIAALGKKNRYFCITRPRRFGKSVMANMVGAFFGNAADAGSLFENLKIAENRNYHLHLNRHHVIYIDFSRMPENCGFYQAYILRIIHGLKEELLEEYAALNLDSAKAVWDILQLIFERTGQRFIFVMDEWDAIFHKSFIQNGDRELYLGFIKRPDICGAGLYDGSSPDCEVFQRLRVEYVSGVRYGYEKEI